MPAFFTHHAVAEEVLKRLPTELYEKIEYTACYFTGAQGADPFFWYRPMKKKGYNLGRTMHRDNVYEFFRAAKDSLPSDCGKEAAYIYGYITHYATDTVFHPYVYGLEREVLSKLPKRRKKDKIHFLIERDIDSFVFEELTNVSLKTYEYPVTLGEDDISAIFRILDEVLWISHEIRPDFDSVRNSLLRFIRQEKYFLDPNGNRRRNLYALEKIFFMPHVLSYMCVRDNPDISFTNYLHEQKPYGSESVYDLARRSIDLSVKLIAEFIAAKNGDELNKALFSTDFNIGKDV